MRSIGCCAVGLVVILLGRAARADEAGARDLVLRTQALEARRTGDWRAALRACAALRGQGPLDPALELLDAEAHLALGDDGPAAAALQRLLAAHPDHAQALFLQAGLAARAGDRAAARAALLAAARAGWPVLQDVQRPSLRPQLGWVLGEPGTILDLMRAAQAYELPGAPARQEARRDPFARPRQRQPGQPPTPPSPRVQALEAEILELLALIDRRLRLSDPDPQELLGAIDRLSELVALHAETPGADPAGLRERLARWAEENGAPGDLRQRVLLRLLLREGNRLLAEVREQLQEDRFDAARSGLSRIDDLAARLRASPAPQGERLAEALQVRARGLADELGDRLALASLPLRVTGVVIPPPDALPSEPPTAIVDERLVRPGDTIPLAGEDDPRRLLVVAITRGGVRLRFGRHELLRPLTPRPR